MNKEDKIQLSILIPTIPSRTNMYNELVQKIHKYAAICYNTHPVLGRVEIVWNDTKSAKDGGITVGEKRDSLVQEANGEYLCFLDDDDNISPDYIETLLRLCYKGKDIVTFRSLFTCDTYWSIIDMDLDNLINQQATPEEIVKRRPWHICPVKSKYAKAFKFEHINNAEDWKWFSQVLTLVETQAKTNRIIHRYNHSATTSEVDAIERQ